MNNGRNMKNTAIACLVVAALGVGCQSAAEPASFSEAPVTGTIAGATFKIAGARVQPVGSRLDITLANVVVQCSVEPRPEAGLLRVDITVPEGAGATAGAEPANVVLAATAMKNGDAGPSQSTIMINGARFRVNGSDAGGFSASVIANQKDLQLTGTFNASVCAAKR